MSKTQRISEIKNPPYSNTGGREKSQRVAQWVVVNGKMKEIPVKVGVNTSAFIDTLTLTIKQAEIIDLILAEEYINNIKELKEEDINHLVATYLSKRLLFIMGFGLFAQQSGRNGYSVSYKMGDDVNNYGFLALGGRSQNGTICLFFTGVGLLAALDGWEQRLYDFLNKFQSIKLTRADLAHDFFNGEYTPDMAKLHWHEGGYTNKNTKPVAECVGGDWLNYRGTGKTFYIGSRKSSSRFCRVYEKGKQLGDSESLWVRVEVEFHNRDIVIPLDILLDAGKYLNGAYPVFEHLFSIYPCTPTRISRIKKLKDVTIPHVIKYASMQSARVVELLKRLNYQDSDIVNILKNGMNELPRRLSKTAFDCKELIHGFYHEFLRMPRNEEELRNKAPRKHNTFMEYYFSMGRFLRKNKFLALDFTNGKVEKGFLRPVSYAEYMAEKNCTPYWILNPNFTGD